MESELYSKVKAYIEDKGMIQTGDRICVAVSGGADSMCLLFLLHRLSAETGFELSAVHVEHGIRGEESLADMEYVQKICKDLGISLRTEHVDAPLAASEEGLSLEEAARNERYRIFEELECDRVALAHHMNDQAETVLFNLIRGSGISGLRGILPVRGRFIRPLLCATREEICAFCEEKGIEFRTDSTNLDTSLSRNKIRHDIIPLLSEINSRAVEHICESAESVAESEKLLMISTERDFEECVEEKEGVYYIDIKKLNACGHHMAGRIVKRVLEAAAGRSKDISRKHVEAVLSLADGQSGRQAGLIYGLKARREFEKIKVWGTGRYEPESLYSIPDVRPGISYTVVKRSDVSDSEIKKDDRYTKYADYAKIKDTAKLDLRHRAEGDWISIKGGRKKLKDLLIEERIPKEERDSLYLLALGSEIVWIPATGRMGERFKADDETVELLRMEIENG